MNNKELSLKQIGLFFIALLVNALWALSYPVSKLVLLTESADQLTWQRLFFSSVAMVIFLRRRDFSSPFFWKAGLLLFLMGILGVSAATIFQYAGTALTLSSHVSLLVGMEPLLLALSALVFMGERPPKYFWPGLFIAFIGVFVGTVNLEQLQTINLKSAYGDGLILISVFFYASYTLFSKSLNQRWSSFALTTLPFIIATMTWPIYLWYKGQWHDSELIPTAENCFPIFFLTIICTCACYFIWNWLVQKLKVALVGFSLFSQSFFGGLFAHWLLGEELSAGFWFGMVLLILGAMLALFREKA